MIILLCSNDMIYLNYNRIFCIHISFGGHLLFLFVFYFLFCRFSIPLLLWTDYLQYKNTIMMLFGSSFVVVIVFQDFFSLELQKQLQVKYGLFSRLLLITFFSLYKHLNIDKFSLEKLFNEKFALVLPSSPLSLLFVNQFVHNVDYKSFTSVDLIYLFFLSNIFFIIII